jgi:hypothetical protein
VTAQILAALIDNALHHGKNSLTPAVFSVTVTVTMG